MKIKIIIPIISALIGGVFGFVYGFLMESSHPAASVIGLFHGLATGFALGVVLVVLLAFLQRKETAPPVIPTAKQYIKAGIIIGSEVVAAMAMGYALSLPSFSRGSFLIGASFVGSGTALFFFLFRFVLAGVTGAVLGGLLGAPLGYLYYFLRHRKGYTFIFSIITTITILMVITIMGVAFLVFVSLYSERGVEQDVGQKVEVEGALSSEGCRDVFKNQFGLSFVIPKDWGDIDCRIWTPSDEYISEGARLRMGFEKTNSAVFAGGISSDFSPTLKWKVTDFIAFKDLPEDKPWHSIFSCNEANLPTGYVGVVDFPSCQEKFIVGGEKALDYFMALQGGCFKGGCWNFYRVFDFDLAANSYNIGGLRIVLNLFPDQDFEELFVIKNRDEVRLDLVRKIRAIQNRTADPELLKLNDEFEEFVSSIRFVE